MSCRRINRTTRYHLTLPFRWSTLHILTRTVRIPKHSISPPTIVDYRRVQSLGSLFLTRAIDAQYGLRMFVCETDKNKRHFRLFDQVIYNRNNLYFLCVQREGDSNPRMLSHLRFSRPSPSATRTSLFLY